MASVMYRKKAVTALIAFLVFLCLLLGAALIWHLTSVSPETADAERSSADGGELIPSETDISQPDIPVQPGMVRGKVLTDSGAMLPCGIIVEDEQGYVFRAVTNALAGYNLSLAPGSYTLTFTRGAEYSHIIKEVTVESYKVNYLQDVRLVRLYDPFSRGWIPGDLHQHSFYSDGADGVYELLLSNISCGLRFGFLSDHNSARGLAEWLQGNHIVADIDAAGQSSAFGAYEAVEVTTEFGHYQSLGVGLTFDTYEVMLRDIERSRTGEEKDDIIKSKIRYIAETIRREGGIAQINHPYSSNTLGFPYWELADCFDTIEIWNGVFHPGDGRYEPEKTSEQGQNYRSKLKWFELLNEIRNGGKFIAATGGTDNHTAASPYKRGQKAQEMSDIQQYKERYEQSGKYSGVPTTYVNCRGDFNQSNILAALKEGHSFVSNGIVVLADINGSTYGDTAALDSTVILSMELFCRDGLEAVSIVKNGEAIIDLKLDPGTVNYGDEIALTGLAAGDWIILEVFGEGCLYAITNPIFFK
jgi:phage tail protein X